MSKRVRNVIIAGAAGALLALGTAPPVAADQTRPGSCPQGWFCGYTEAGYLGEWVGGAQANICYTPMNGAQSAANRTGHTIRFYSEPSCRGEYFDLETEYGMARTPFPVASTGTGWY